MSSQRFVKCFSFRTSTHYMTWSSLRLPDDSSSGDSLYGPYNGLSINDEKLENLEAQGTTSIIVPGNY